MEVTNRRVRAAAPVFGDRVSNAYIKGFLSGAKQAGHDPQLLLEEAGIPRTAYTNRRSSLNGEQFQRLMMVVRETMNDQYMGFLKIPGKLAMDMHSGCTAVQSETLGQGMRQITEFINAVRHDEVRNLNIDEGDGISTLGYKFYDFNKGVEPHFLYVFRMYWDYRFFCWLVGQQIKLTRVCFTAPESEYAFDYARCFGCEVLYDQAENTISFDHGHLVLPIVRSQLALMDGDFTDNFPDWFVVPGNDQSIASQVEQILLELRDDGMFSPSIDFVAEVMMMGRRTLSRKLAKERISFQKIKTKIRRDLAKKYLLTSDISIAGISSKVGFAEPCDFTRAFIRWEGLTPSSYREVCLAE